MLELDESSKQLFEVLRTAREKSAEDLYSAIVNCPFKTILSVNFEIGTIVLLIDNPKSGYIERIALSKTPAAEGAVMASSIPFSDIKIPRDFKDSAHVESLKSKKMIVLSDWYKLFAPSLTSEQARANQNRSGISSSVVVPFFGKKCGTIIFSLYCTEHEIDRGAFEFFKWYSQTVADLII